MSYRSPSISVIGSPSNFEALVFFHGPIHSVLRSRFNYVEVVLGSGPSAVSFIPCLVARSGPLSSCVMVAPATTIFSMAMVCSMAAFTTSWEALTSSASYSFCFCCASSLTASFCLCIAASSHAARSRLCHLHGHESSTANTTSLIAVNSSLVQFCSGSFHALIYTLCISALKYANLLRLSYTVGDRRSRLWIHIHMLTSMSIQKILILQMHVACLVTQNNAYFAASGKSWSRGGN